MNPKCGENNSTKSDEKNSVSVRCSKGKGYNGPGMDIWNDNTESEWKWCENSRRNGPGKEVWTVVREAAGCATVAKLLWISRRRSRRIILKFSTKSVVSRREKPFWYTRMTEIAQWIITISLRVDCAANIISKFACLACCRKMLRAIIVVSTTMFGKWHRYRRKLCPRIRGFRVPTIANKHGKRFG